VKRSNRLVILVGVLLAVLAFVAIVILLNQPGGPGTGEEPLEPTRVTVLVATRDIELGESVTPDLVTEQEIDPEAEQRTALRSTSAVAGERAIVPIPEGSQVTAEKIGLLTTVDIDIAARLNPGERAVTFQVDRATGVDFLVKEGDLIDIILTVQVDVLQETADSIAREDPETTPPRFEAVPGLENQRTVKAVLQNKRVLYVSQTRARAPEMIDTDGDGVPDAEAEAPPIENVIIVFAGTDQDAEVIKYAQNDFTEVGSLSAVIRHADYDAIEETIGITIDQLVEEYGVRIPGIVELLLEGTEPAP
jgi:Flp pilus assembly protein CpaB